MTIGLLKDSILAILTTAPYALSARTLAERTKSAVEFGGAGPGNPVDQALAELVDEGRIYWQGSRTERVYYTSIRQLR